MLTHIVRNNEQLCTFVRDVGVQLSKPQLRHVLNVADALLVAVGAKTLSNLYRQLFHSADVSNMAATFRRAPWTPEAIAVPLRRQLMARAVKRVRRLMGEHPFLLINIDDSVAIKDPDTHHLQGVDWLYDHSASRRRRNRMQNGLSYLDCNIVAAGWTFTLSIQPYLREKTVRRLNRSRDQEQRLQFVSMPRLVQRILAEVRPLVPSDIQVYVQFDSWFASQRLLKYIARQGWHTICRIKSNRILSGHKLTDCFASQRHQRCHRAVICAADDTQTTYLLRQQVGRLRDLPFDVRVLESRRHYRDHHPAYMVCTDLALSPQQVVQRYAKRWNCEIDNWYLKLHLGLGDFRLQSYEAITKFLAVVHLSWAYIQQRAEQQDLLCISPAQVIRQHQDEHAYAWLVQVCQEVLAAGSLEPALRRYLLPTLGT